MPGVPIERFELHSESDFDERSTRLHVLGNACKEFNLSQGALRPPRIFCHFRPIFCA